MQSEITFPKFPPKPGDEPHKYLASVGVSAKDLGNCCIKKATVTAVRTRQTVDIDLGGVEYIDVPVWMHTDCGARTALISETESALPEDYFKDAALMFPFPGGVTVGDQVTKTPEVLVIEHTDPETEVKTVHGVVHILQNIFSTFVDNMQAKGWSTYKPYCLIEFYNDLSLVESEIFDVLEMGKVEDAQISSFLASAYNIQRNIGVLEIVKWGDTMQVFPVYEPVTNVYRLEDDEESYYPAWEVTNATQENYCTVEMSLETVFFGATYDKQNYCDYNTQTMRSTGDGYERSQQHVPVVYTAQIPGGNFVELSLPQFMRVMRHQTEDLLVEIMTHKKNVFVDSEHEATYTSIVELDAVMDLTLSDWLRTGTLISTYKETIGGNVTEFYATSSISNMEFDAGGNIVSGVSHEEAFLIGSAHDFFSTEVNFLWESSGYLAFDGINKLVRHIDHSYNPANYQRTNYIQTTTKYIGVADQSRLVKNVDGMLEYIKNKIALLRPTVDDEIVNYPIQYDIYMKNTFNAVITRYLVPFDTRTAGL